MKRFRFTLQAVQTVRERQEELARRAVACVVARLEAAQRRWQDARAACVAAAAAQRAVLAAGATAAELMVHATHRRALEAYAEDCARAVAQWQTELQRAVETWRSTRQARDVVERVRARQWTQFQRALAVEEQKTLDERAVQMAAREQR